MNVKNIHDSSKDDNITSTFHHNKKEILKNSRINTGDVPSIDYNDGFLLEKLGEGGAGRVYKVYDKRLEKFVAYKSSIKCEEKFLEDLKYEDDLLQRIEAIRKTEKNTQFLIYYGFFEDPERQYSNSSLFKKLDTGNLILNDIIASGKNLNDLFGFEGQFKPEEIDQLQNLAKGFLLQNKSDEINNVGLFLLKMESGIATLDDILVVGKSYDYAEVLYFLKKLVESFAILQKNGIAHRDIKALNIILIEDDDNSNERFSYKISDFGIGCVLPKECNDDMVSVKSITGATESYVAPEVLMHLNKIKNDPYYENKYNPFVADVYSLGILALKMIKYSYGKTTIRKGLLNKKKFREKYQILAEILQQMLEENPYKRMDFIKLKDYLDKMNTEALKFSKELNLEGIELYYEKYLDKKEEKNCGSKRNLEALYKEHWKLCQIYNNKISRFRQGFNHLERAWRILKDIRKKILESKEDSEIIKIDEIDVDKWDGFNLMNFENEESMMCLEISCLNQYGIYYRRMVNFEKSEEYFMESLQKCEELQKKKLETKKNFFKKCEEIQKKKSEEKFIEKNSKKCEENLEENSKINEELQKKKSSNIKENYEYFGGTFGNLSVLYYEKGDFHKAEEFSLKSLNSFQKGLCENHPLIAQIYNNLGFLYHHNGQFDKSEEFYLKSLRIRQDFFGENYSDTALSYSNLGILYKEMGHFAKSEEFLTKGLKIRQMLFGEKHEETANSYNNLGYLYIQLGKLEEAEKNILKALKIQESLFGENFSSTAQTYKKKNKLGFLYEKMEKLKKAEEFHRKGLEIMKKIFGENHSNVLIFCNNLACLFEKMGKLTKAEKFLLKALHIHQNLLYKNPLETCTIYINLGLFYMRMNKNFNEAKEIFLKALKIQENHHLGENSSNIANTYDALADLVYKFGGIKKGKELYVKVMNIRRNVYGENHADVANSYSNVGVILVREEKFIKAEELFLKALKIQRKIQGENHSNTYNSLGVLYKAKRDFQTAEEFLQIGLKIRTILFEENHENHAEIADSYNNLGELFSNMENFTKAEEFHQKALQIRLNLYKENHCDTADSYNNLGFVFYNVGKFNMSKELILKAVKIRMEIVGKNHPEIAIYYNNLGLVFYKMEIICIAEENFMKALKIQLEFYGEKSFRYCSLL